MIRGLSGKAPAGRGRLLIEAALVLLFVGLGLRILPFTALSRVLDRPHASMPRAPADRVTVRRAMWAIRRAGKHFPEVSSCLCQAVAGRILLGRRGAAPELRIGVSKAADGSLEAHAWLTLDGAVILGGPEHSVRRYQSLCVLSGRRA